MRLQAQVFGSRVARRVFVFFLIASLVPLLGFAALALLRVGSALEQQAFRQLDDASRSYGQITFDKLVAAADNLEDGDAIDASSAGDLPGLDAAAVAQNGAVRTLFGDWQPANLPSPSPGSRAAVTVVARDGASDVILSQAHGDLVVHGRVAPEYLRRTDGLLAAGMDVCLFSSLSLRTPIHCSAPLPDSAVAASTAQEPSSERHFSWRNEDEEWLTSHWQVFLPSQFAADAWIVVVSQPRESALSSLAAFNTVVPQAALLTLALIVVLAVSQIRHTMNPLDALLAGTKRIAAEDFSTPVRIASRDEFGVLGDALNGMAGQLDRQFGALRALAEIDRSILQSADLEPVLVTLFDRLDRLVPGADHLVLVIDSDNPAHGHVYRRRHAMGIERERIKVSQELRDWLAAAGPDCVTDVATLAALGLAAGRDATGGAAYAVPIVTGDLPTGVLVTSAARAEPERASIRELVARVAVAISAGKREAELFRRAHFDMLTSLPNRELLDDRLRQAVAQAERDERLLAVLFIDLDGFKEINDRFGHRSGDELLKETALRLTSVLRHGDTVARLGGDEYAIVLPQIYSALEAETVAIKAIEMLRRPFAVDGHETYVSASIGLAIFPEDGRTAADLLRRADMAMYTAKDAGKSCYRFFAEEMDRRLQERHSLHSDLRNALAAGEFALAYQPQVDLRTGEFVSVEALLRWRHPSRGPVSPALFIPILEETGLIKEIGAWVFEKALADFASWQQAGLSFERVAVNVSTRQLLDRNFAEQLTSAVAEAGLVGHRLEIELTEASLVEDFRAANDVLSQLRGHGIRIALDDFGTGYSSLAYLNELAFDTLKIDRAFVVNLPAEKSVAIVKAIVAVATALGKVVVAEGIESGLQHGQLAALGCDLGQGYLIAKPMSAQDLVAWAVAQPAAEQNAPRRASRNT
jgi:diguanylate cyclase (GGDEF)-like protein